MKCEKAHFGWGEIMSLKILCFIFLWDIQVDRAQGRCQVWRYRLERYQNVDGIQSLEIGEHLRRD